ncbi:MAG: DMT family transporter [Pseudomonadales bacterium]|nr:DMT family transporter [Pseudomonadales bacterium]
MMGFVPVLIFGIDANEATIGFARLAIGTFGIALLMMARREFRQISRRELFWLASLGIMFAVHWYLYFWSIKRAGAALAAIAVCTFGIHLLLVNRVAYGDRIRRIDLCAVAIAIGGVMIATPFHADSFEQGIGFIVGVFSGFLYACLPPINRQIAHLPTNFRALGQFGFGFIGFLFLWPLTEWQTLQQHDWYGLLALGVICTIGAHTLWNKVSTELPGNLTAVISYLYIPLAMLLSALFLDEAITWQMVAGATLIITANLLVALTPKAKSALSDP